MLKLVSRMSPIAFNQLLARQAKGTWSQIAFVRLLSVQKLNSNMSLVSSEKVKIEKEDGVPVFKFDSKKPLTLLLGWMMAKDKHLLKYSSVYLNKGFNVLQVKVTPWQLTWPETGAQVVADDLLKILSKNTKCDPLLIHGFSVGGYLWGEVMLRMDREPEKYKPIVDKFVAQVWDSAADITEIPKGFPTAVFPKNALFRSLMEGYIKLHMKLLENKVTRHYRASSHYFHKTILRAPALFIVSNSDPIGPPSSNNRVRDSWDSLGLTTRMKVFEDTKHVAHFATHPKEYLEELEKFLKSVKLYQ